MPERILFVSHDASVSGAPILLLHFMNWLKTNTKASFAIIVKENGPLIKEFEKTCDTYIWQQNLNYNRKAIAYNASRIIKRFTGKSLYRPFPKKLKQTKFDLVYLNTIATIDLGPFLKKIYNCLVIAHIHEGQYSLRALYKGFNSDINRAAIDQYIAVSAFTRDIVSSEFHVKHEKISLVYGFINTANLKNASIETEFEAFYKDAFVVGAVGQGIWRKGVDLFIAIAALFKKNHPDLNIKFVWVGDTGTDTSFAGKLQYELQHHNLQNSLLFTGLSKKAQAFYKRFDILALTSREDPFPLVCLEAASYETPIICFKNAGGMPEFVKNAKAGETIEYGDINLFADAILKLYNDEALRIEYGLNAKTYAQNFNVEKGSSAIYTIIKKLLHNKR